MQLKHKHIKEVREWMLIEQAYKCPLCGYPIDPSDSALDHQHRTKLETIGVDGAGLVRGVLHRNCNSVEGQMLGKFKRSGVKDIKFSDFLRNLAEYYDETNYNLIHPNERKEPTKMGKRIFNRISVAYRMKYPKRKPLEYPKSGLLTKKFADLIEELEIPQ